MAKVVSINREQFSTSELAEMEGVLAFIGYDIRYGNSHEDSDLIIDKRSADFITWKNALSCITVMHPQDMLRYHQEKREHLDRDVHRVYTMECGTEEDATCFV